MNPRCASTRLCCCLTVWLWMLPLGLFAQPQSASPASAPKAKKIVTAVLTESSIVLDGILDEPVWKTTVPATDFVEREPSQGQPATERTEVRVAYDNNAIYFGMTAYDSQPDHLVINTLEQDFAHSNQDGLVVYLDTFDDDRNAYVYYINPAGAKKEMQTFDEGRDQIVEWEDVWDVRTRTNESGWVAEVRIPFKSLRFAQGETQRWGINFGR